MGGQDQWWAWLFGEITSRSDRPPGKTIDIGPQKFVYVLQQPIGVWWAYPYLLEWSIYVLTFGWLRSGQSTFRTSRNY